jgi:hypothetical protein
MYNIIYKSMSVHGGTLHHQGSNVAVVPLLKNVPKYYQILKIDQQKVRKNGFMLMNSIL